MNTDKKNLVYISIDELYHHPDNPRCEIGDVTELSDSIRSKGIMQNLTVVRGHKTADGKESEEGYTVIIGHRRMTAAKLAGLTELPCVIAELSYHEQVATMLLENMQRSDLTVFEQAKGIQMLIDFGETVEGISEKTGFSKTTVRRRLELTKLDEKALKDASARQVSMADYERLSKIDDIEERNKLCCVIGTNDFEFKYKAALKKQKIAQKLPFVKKVLEELGAKDISRSETYSSKYERITTVYFEDWDTNEPLFKERSVKNESLFFFLEESFGSVGVYRKAPKAKRETKTPEAKLHESAVASAWERAKALEKLTYELRRDFIENFTMTASTKDAVLRGAVMAIAAGAVSFISSSGKSVKDLVGFVPDTTSYDPDEGYKAMAVIREVSPSLFPKMVYLGFADKDTNAFWYVSSKDFPKFYKNTVLETLYAWLEMLGYEMSEEERQLREGTHELFLMRTDKVSADDRTLEKLKEMYGDE